MKRLIIELPEELHTALKLAAVNQGSSMRQIILDLITNYIKHYDREKE